MAMVKKSITITDQQEQWIQAQLATGHYASDSEVLRDLIRREQKRDVEVQAIRAALIEGEASGISPLSADDIREDVLKRLREDGKL
jgi:antitoxin ParD1/3/4